MLDEAIALLKYSGGAHFESQLGRTTLSVTEVSLGYLQSFRQMWI